MLAKLHILRCHCGTLCSVVAYVLTMLGVAWVVLHGAESMGYNWQWYRVPRFILLPDGSPGPLLQGAGITLLVSGLGLVGAAVLALGTALVRLSSSLVGKAVARCYLELIRNTPLLVQIFFIYFVLAPAVGLGRLPSAVLALALFEGAYASEVIRAGILAIPRGQWEGALSLGMGNAGHPAPGPAQCSPPVDQPGGFAHQGFSPCFDHRHFRPDHARTGYCRGNFSQL